MRRYSTHQNVNMKILWRKMGSKLILNTPKNQRQKLKNRNRTIIWFNPPFNKVSTNIAKIFLFWSTDIVQSLIDYKNFSSETQWRLVTAVCKLRPKYTKDIILRLHPHHVTKLYNCRVYKKYVPWTVNATFRTQIMTVVSLHQSREKSTLGWKKENGRKGVIIINGQQWGIPHLTETSQKSVLCLYEKLVIINYPRQ